MDKINMKCWCGCDSFWIQESNHKNSPLIKCQRCKAERIVITPGVAVKVYEVSPEFQNKEVKCVSKEI